MICSYEVKQKISKQQAMEDITNFIRLKYPNHSGIIYCSSRKDTEKVCEALKAQNITCNFYHGRLSKEDRSHRQNEWASGKFHVMIATVAVCFSFKYLKAK